MNHSLEHPRRISPLPDLPIEIIVYIFCRLPVKTLLRFKCLSKQFLSVINSPDFINRHLQFSSMNPKLILFEQRKSLQFHLLNVDTSKAYDFNISYADLGTDRRNPWFLLEVIGSCDGLVALSNRHTGTTFLCNVATRKHKILPVCLNHAVEPQSLDLVRYGFGRGRGASFDDYKLVMVTSRIQQQEASLSVYSLKTDSWKTIVDFPSYLVFNRTAAYVNGTLNWFCSERKYVVSYYKILSVDLNNDSFIFTELPNCIDGKHSFLKGGGDCLCLLEVLNSVPFAYNIWTMKEHGVKNSWMKMYRVSFPEEIIGLYDNLSRCVLSKHLDKLFFIHTYEEVFVWHLKEGRCEINRPLSLPSWCMGLNLTSESLVPLGTTG